MHVRGYCYLFSLYKRTEPLLRYKSQNLKDPTLFYIELCYRCENECIFTRSITFSSVIMHRPPFYYHEHSFFYTLYIQKSLD